MCKSNKNKVSGGHSELKGKLAHLLENEPETTKKIQTSAVRSCHIKHVKLNLSNTSPEKCVSYLGRYISESRLN